MGVPKSRTTSGTKEFSGSNARRHATSLKGRLRIPHVRIDALFAAVVASVTTLRRWDRDRPIALYAPAKHIDTLRQTGLLSLFAVVDVLPEENQSVVGFKHNLHKFMPFDRNLFVDCDVVWCRDPDPSGVSSRHSLLQQPV